MRRADAAETVPILAPAARYDTTGGAESVERLAAAGRCFLVEQDGRPIMAYVLQVQGREVFVLAAAGAAEFDLTAFALEVIEAQAAGFDTVAFQTKRRGLMRKAQARGYAKAGRVHDGIIMRKRI